MDVSFTTQDIFTGKHDAAVLFTYNDRSEAETRLEKRIGKNVRIARERKEFKGDGKEVFVEIRADTPRFVAVAGLGKKDDLTPALLREAAGEAAARLRDMGAKSIAVEPPKELDAQAVGQAVTEGVLLASYQFTKYKTQKLDDIKRLESLTVVSDRTGVGVKKGVDTGRVIAESVNVARDLQNTPSQDLTPELLANEAARMAKQDRLKCRILDRKQLEKQGYHAILAVGRGSVNEPRLVTVEYAPKNAKRTIAVVGKGITFDTGGISLKPGQKMSDMKFDMSGAAAVLGVLRNAARLKLPVRVIGVLGLAENMPSGTAYKPGDIVKTKSGKTIEVDNTDAEGRIVLADALYHATTFKPDMMLNFATLTGAVIVALGDVAAGLMGNDEDAVAKVRDAAERSGERVWQLPLWDIYERDIESQVADVRNMGLPRMAGTIAAGMFLKQFVQDVPWAHLDIAGVSWTDARDNYFTRKGTGGTGFGVRLVTELLRST